MTEQLHQRFSTEEIKTFLEEYLDEKSNPSTPSHLRQEEKYSVLTALSRIE